MAATSVHLANQSLDASPDSSRESWSQLSLCNNRSDINGNSSTTDSFTLSSNIIASSNDQQHTSPVDFIDSHFTSDVVSKGIYEKLRIVAQPRASYRERYQSEMAPARNGAQRFIRAEEGSTYEYPTISVRAPRPLRWMFSIFVSLPSYLWHSLPQNNNSSFE